MDVKILTPVDQAVDEGVDLDLDGSDGDYKVRVRSGSEQARAVVRTVERAVSDLDRVRQSLALEYSAASNGTVAEFELGEALQAVRKAVVRSRKALGELMQQELPLPLV